MNPKLVNKANKIIAVLARCTGASNVEKEKAIGYFLAYDAQLPSSAGRLDLSSSSNLAEAKVIISVIGENSMLDARTLLTTVYAQYELRHAAAFNGMLFAAKMDRVDMKMTPLTIKSVVSLFDSFIESGVRTESTAVSAV